MSTELARVTAALEALGDDATAEQIAEAIRSYSKRDISAAMFSLTDGGGGSASISSPLDIPGCQLWLDASTLALADNAAVASWPDGSPNGWDAVQATAANKPVCKTAIQNGLRVVRFNGVDVAGSKYLDLPAGALALLNGKPGVTLAYVIGNETASTNYASTIYISRNSDSTKRRFYVSDIAVSVSTDDSDTYDALFYASEATLVAAAGGDPYNDSYPFAGIQATTPAFAATVVRVDLAAGGLLSVKTADGGFLAGLADPTPGVTYSPFSTVGSHAGGVSAFAATNSAVVRIGETDPVGNGYGIVGDMAELVVYDRALKARESRELTEYLSEKWATV